MAFSLFALLILFLVKNKAEKAVTTTTNRGLKFLGSIENFGFYGTNYAINTAEHYERFIHSIDFKDPLFAASDLTFFHVAIGH
jgi:hypothetical protein